MDTLGLFDLIPYDAKGHCFDPIRDILYVANSNTNQIIAYDYLQLLELARIDIEADFDEGELIISADTNHLFLSNEEDGVFYFPNPVFFLPGDVNLDRSVDLLDVFDFVELLQNGDYQPEADINSDGSLNLLDVQKFVTLLTN